MQPEPGPGEAVLRVQACGICGTDLRILAGAHRAYPPGTRRIPGHEIAGTLVACGSGVTMPEGTPAFIAPNIGCGQCKQCKARRINLCTRPRALGISLDGGFAEYLLLPADLIAQGNILPVPEGRDPGAIALVEPLACVLRGSRACEIEAGDVVLISGAGPIGLLHLGVARLRAPRAIVVSDPNAERRARAQAWGADHVVDPFGEDLPGLIAQLSGGDGADAVIVAAPAPQAQEQAITLAAPGGRINFFGGLPKDDSRITVDANTIHYRELIVTGTTANTTEDCREALALVTTGQIDTSALIGARYTLTESPAAFAASQSRQVLKVVLQPAQ
jgi:L-iditol 2-dehydrogenase